MAESLRDRILEAFNRDGPGTYRVVNAGTLEEELWTDDNWRDEYSEYLQRELDAMVTDGLLVATRTLGMQTYGLKTSDV